MLLKKMKGRCRIFLASRIAGIEPDLHQRSPSVEGQQDGSARGLFEEEAIR